MYDLKVYSTKGTVGPVCGCEGIRGKEMERDMGVHMG